MITQDELNKIAAMSYFNPDDAITLFKEVNTILLRIKPLREVNTTDIQPLLHPQDITQRLRHDVVLDTNHCESLAKLAPLFMDELYLVPKVIE